MFLEMLAFRDTDGEFYSMLIQIYLDKHGIKFPVGIAEDEHLQNIYGANGLPALVLIDRRGLVRYTYGSGEDDHFKRLLDRCLSE